MSSISFTGHRTVTGDKNHLEKILYAALEKEIQNGAYDFYAGGALGFDTMTAVIVIRLRKTYPQIKLHLVLPCPPEEQSSLWSQADRELFYKTITEADTVEIVSEHLTKECMKARNAKLIEYADKCFCYYNPGRSRSGTGQTVRMARRKGIEIVKFYDNIL